LQRGFQDGVEERERIEYQLRGKTLKVYLYMLRQGKPVGVREVQRELGLSSPSVAFHHIEKLVRLGVVEQDKLGDYFVAKKVDPGIMQAFVNVGRFSLPRVAFYSVFFTTIAAAYLVSNLDGLDVYALVGTLGCAVVFWYELLRVWKRRPF
jgi:predicted DNA-binding transcriptional regulator